MKEEDKAKEERNTISEEKLTILNNPHYSIEVKEVDVGIIIDVFHRHGELIDSFTYWNDDVIEEKK